MYVRIAAWRPGFRATVLGMLLCSASGLAQNAQDRMDTVRLYAPRPAYRSLVDASALLNYFLKAAPRNPVTIEILESKGAVVCRLPSIEGRAGLNRVSWDMRYTPPRLVALRTTPPQNPHIWEEPRFQGADTRPVLHRGIDQAQVGPIAAPGQYTVRLTVDGAAYTQPLEILRPPDSHGTDADLQASVRLQLKLRDDISTVADMTNQIEWMRRQLEDQHKITAVRNGEEALRQAMEAIDQKLQEVEYQLISRSDALSDEKAYVEAAKLYLNFLWLNGTIGTGTGKYAGSADYAQTETAITLVYNLERQLQAVQAEYKDLMEKDVAAYNRSIAASGIAPLQRQLNDR
jgi:hypothetical protein